MPEAKDAASAAPAASDERTVSVAQALDIAKQLHQKRDMAAARSIYERILAGFPNQPDALHYLGLLEFDEGRPDKARPLIERSLEFAPNFFDAHLNLSNILKETGENALAEVHLRRALELQPANAAAFNNLGLVIAALGRIDEAVAAAQQATKLTPWVAVYYINLGVLLQRQGSGEAAVAALRRALELEPDNSTNRGWVVRALAGYGQVEEARAICEEWQRAEPDNPVVQHQMGALGAGAVPERAPDEYVRNVFDNFASSFESQLRLLKYRAPELVLRALAARVAAEGRLDILDAGCGTGLCGPLLRPLARRLDGLDLSPRMLDYARERQVYDHLIEAELTAALVANPERYDAIVAADVLCYFGDLKAVLGAAATALHPGGLLVFSVEHAADPAPPEGFLLNLHGRYSHVEDYVVALVQQAGLLVEQCDHEVLRQEHQHPVNGLVVTARRPATR